MKLKDLYPENTVFQYLNPGGKANFLTASERKLMLERAKGLTYKEIAKDVSLSQTGKSRSPETIKTHASNVYHKINNVHWHTFGYYVPEYTARVWGGEGVHMGTGFALYFLALTAILEINAYQDVGPSEIIETIQSVNKQFDAKK